MSPEDEAPEVRDEPSPPTREDIKIRDLTAGPGVCSVCGEAKTPYIEVEVDGALEYTCRECYEGESVEIVACRGCGAALEPGDNFCGKCGTPRVLKCPSCGAECDEEDRFCGKCGGKLT